MSPSNTAVISCPIPLDVFIPFSSYKLAIKNGFSLVIPGIFVQRIFQGNNYEKRIEQRTVLKGSKALVNYHLLDQSSTNHIYQH